MQDNGTYPAVHRAMICAAPLGMFNKVDWNLVKPKPLTMRGPKAETPPWNRLALPIKWIVPGAYIWNVVRNSKQVQQPEPHVHEGFLDLIPLELLIVDTRLVLYQPEHSNGLLPLVQPGSCKGIWRHEEVEEDTPDDGDRAENNERELPGRNVGLDEANAVPDETTEDVGHTVHREPDTGSERLLGPISPVSLIFMGKREFYVLLVVHSGQENEAWADTSLESTQKEPGSNQTRKVMSRSHAQEYNTPERDEDGADFCDVEFLEQDVDRELGEEVTDVEDGCQPGVLCSHEMGICLHSP